MNSQLKLKLLQILCNPDQSRDLLHNGSICYCHHPPWQNQLVALVYNAHFQLWSPSSTSHRKLAGWYTISVIRDIKIQHFKADNSKPPENWQPKS